MRRRRLVLSLAPALFLAALGFAALFIFSPTLFGAASPEPSLWQETLLFIRAQQQAFAALLGAGVRSLGEGYGLEAAIHLSWLSFLYGVFHALGPGHGKAVISAFALSRDLKVRAAVGLAMTSSLVQGLTAIVIVGGAYLLVEGGLRTMALSAEDLMEPLSYGAVTLVGAVLLWRGLRPGRTRGHAKQLPAASADDHHHAHDHHDGCCSHAPTAAQLEQARDWPGFFGIVLAVGIRPCTGALLVLVLAFVLGHWLGGLAAVLAMSLGTGLTVTALALAAKGVRWPLLRLLEGSGLRADVVGRALATAGGLVICLIGGTLLYTALSTPAHPFL